MTVADPPRSQALTIELVHEVMSRLATQRKLFHSEADFQHAFAQLLVMWRPALEIRLEVPYRVIGSTDRTTRTMVDLYCRDPASGDVAAIEFKYRTREWTGTVGREEFQLLDHSAVDLGRRSFVEDISRLERWTRDAGGLAFAILLTNEPAFWLSPTDLRPTIDADFRLHEGRTLAGDLRWGTDEHAADVHTLRGRFPMHWRDYSELGDQGTALEKARRLRYLVAAM